MKNLWRFLGKNKIYTLINLFGMVMALTACIFIFLFVLDELSYDKYLAGAERIYRIQPTVSSNDGNQEWATSEGFIVPALAPMLPEIESATRFLKSSEDVILTVDSSNFSQEGVIAADSAFFKVFPFEFIEGEITTAFNRTDQIVISREVALKLFGTISPIGKIMVVEGSTFVVSGVVENTPASSHFHFKIALPLKFWVPDADRSRTSAFYSYVRLKPLSSVKTFRESLSSWYAKYGYAFDADRNSRTTQVVLNAKPIADIHLQSHAEREFETNGDRELVWIFSSVAFLILLVAAINYTNLSNAIAFRRMKEVAIRKTIGASRSQVFRTFLVNSYGFTLVALLGSLIVVTALMREVGLFIGKTFHPSTLLTVEFISMFFMVWIVLGFLSGFYPATTLSSFNPIRALKSNLVHGRGSKFSVGVRRGLIAFQFAVSSVMIVCAFTIQQQMDFIDSRNIGFDKNDVVLIKLPFVARGKLETLKTEILKSASVESAAISSVAPGKRVWFMPIRIPDLAGVRINPQGKNDGTMEIRVLAVDHDFIQTFKLTIVEGRDFSITNASDKDGAFILNEAALKEFNLPDPIGRPFEYLYGDNPKKGSVIGVIQDFNFASLHTKVEPLVLHVDPTFFSTLSVRIKHGTNVQRALSEIEDAWGKVVDLPFKYDFLDTSYSSLYQSERTTATVMTSLTVLALVIACLGLFGVVSFFIAQRTREVGIRKVFGATRASLFRVLSNEYIFIVIIGNLVALYPAWHLSKQWLMQFADQTEFSWTTFALAFGFSGTLALLSIIHIIVKTSNADPSKILRSE